MCMMGKVSNKKNKISRNSKKWGKRKVTDRSLETKKELEQIRKITKQA